MADFYYFFVKTVSKSNYDINNVCFTLTLIQRTFYTLFYMKFLCFAFMWKQMVLQGRDKLPIFGAWESLIRSVKITLKLMVHGRLFTEESLNTFLYETESLLNFRPLTHISDYRNDHHCVKSVLIRRFFWSVCGKIRTRKNSVYGHFSRSAQCASTKPHRSLPGAKQSQPR